MKNVNHLLYLGLLVFFSCHQSEKAKVVDTQSFISKFVLDLNDDHKKDTILISDSKTDGDPGVFKRISIQGKGIIPFEFATKDAWDTIPSELRNREDNAAKTHLFFAKRHKKVTYIILTGWQYSTGREDFAIISVSRNKCKVLTEENFQYIPAMEDFNNDGNIDIALNPSWAEGIAPIDSLGISIATYAPYFVYTLTPETFTLDSALTREYNQKNYVRAGLKYSDDIRVAYMEKDNRYKLLKE